MDVTLIGGTTPRQMPMDSSGNTSITAPATGNSIYKDSIICVFQLTSAAAATAVIEGSLDNSNWCPITGTTATSTNVLTSTISGAARKTLRSALAGWAGSAARAEDLLIKAGIDPQARGEQCDISDFANLAMAAKS